MARVAGTYTARIAELNRHVLDLNRRLGNADTINAGCDQRIAALEAEVKRVRTVKNGRIADLAAEVERLSLRCQRADECIVDFENATGGLPAAQRMRSRIEELEKRVAFLGNAPWAAMEAEVKRLREALGVYADETSWKGYAEYVGPRWIGCDGGQAARKALEPEEVSNEMPKV